MKFKFAFTLAAVLVCGVEFSEPLKVLGVFPTFGQSHWNVGNGLLMSLVEAGHEVTMVSAFPLKKPMKNYRDVKIEGVFELFDNYKDNFNPFDSIGNPWVAMPIMTTLFDSLSDLALMSPEVQKLLKSDEKFDVILVEIFMSESLIGLGEHFNAPVIAVSTFGSNKWVNDLTGTPAPSSIVPSPFLSLTQDMTFCQRVYNTVFNIYVDAFTAFVHLPRQKSIYNKHFSHLRRTFEEAYKSVSLVFLNTHISLGSPLPYSPNMIEVGGVNIDRSNKTLPKDLETLITSAKHGVIYFSLGSHIPSSLLPKKTIAVFVEAFRKLKQTVLWKLDNPAVIGDNAPKNLYTQTWFPQNEVLAHPNVKFFISHGGLLSTTETVYHGKPIIGIPVLGDQYLNIAIAVGHGFAIKVDYNTITLEQFEHALNEMLNNPSYAENIKRISSLYRDQPMTPRQTVAYWTEYVVRHKGAPHMQSKAVEMSYMAKNGVDVAATLIVLVSAMSIAIFYSCLCCCKRFRSGKSNKKNTNNKKTN